MKNRLKYILIILILCVPCIIEMFVRIILDGIQYIITGKATMTDNVSIANFILKFEPK